jgi:hypothetical protein
MNVKQKIAIVLMGGTLAVSLPTMAIAADTNPFADVPDGDWTYDAVAGLVHQGLIRGFGDNDFSKSQILTRNEMAVLVAKAMSKEDKADLATKDIIDKLVSEYADELKAIGVQREGLPQKEANLPLNRDSVSKLDRFSFSGTGRIRFDQGDTGAKTVQRGTNMGKYTPNSHINIDINYAYKINDAWSLYGENEYGRQLNYGGENETLQNSVFEQMYINGPIGDIMIKAGRFSAYSPQGLVYDDKVTGAQMKFGKVLKTTIEAGKATSTDDNRSVTLDSGVYNYNSQNYQSILFDVPLNKTSNLHAGYYHIGGNVLQHQFPANYVSYYTIGADMQLAENLRLDTAYAKSNADGVASSGITSKNDTAYLFKLTYKTADLTKPKTFDLFAMYRKSPQLASYSNTDDWCQNVKGIRIGGDYVFTKNMGMTAWYSLGKDVDTNEKNNMYRVQWNFLL